MTNLQKRNKIIVIIVSVLVILGLSVFLYNHHMCTAYSDRFLPSTYINDVNVGKLSVADAEKKIAENQLNYTLEMKFRNKTTETISAKEPFIINYTANQDIRKIEIYTLQHFNDTIQSGENISNQFLVDDDKPLYTKIPKAYNILNRDFYSEPYNTISLVCKIPAKRQTGQFKVKVILSDNRVLEAETLPIQFIENYEN